MKIQILGRGDSIIHMRKPLPGMEVWTVNMMQFVVEWDRAFWLDNFHYLLERSGPFLVHKIGADAYAKGKQVYTINPPDFGFLQAFPHQEIATHFGTNWFNNSMPWMIAYAIFLRRTGELHVQEIWLDGVDYAEKQENRKEQHACTAYWCGIAHANGIKISVNENSLLLDTAKRRNPRWQPYGLHPWSWGINNGNDGVRDGDGNGRRGRG